MKTLGAWLPFVAWLPLVVACDSGKPSGQGTSSGSAKPASSPAASGSASPKPSASAAADKPAFGGSPRTVVAGIGHICRIMPDATLTCWGPHNDKGQIGDGSTADAATPKAIAGVKDVTQLSLTWDNTCARTSDGKVYCWGANNNGQLGDGTTTEQHAPKEVPGLEGVKYVAIGSGVGCAVMGDGSVKCWGKNFGEPGTPITIDGVAKATQVSVAEIHACARLEDGGARCWGAGGEKTEAGTLKAYANGQWGVLGVGNEEHVEGVATPVGLSGVAEVQVTRTNSCARLEAGGVKCWGLGDDGQIGNGKKENQLKPTDVSGITNATALVISADTFCARLADGTAKCWGSNGQGSFSPLVSQDGIEATPIAVPNMNDIEEIAVGGASVCVLRASKQLVCTGANAFSKHEGSNDVFEPVAF